MIPKFRIWDKTNKEMLEWEELDLNKERGEDEITIFEPTGQFAHPIFFYDAMQSTGARYIYDENGKEIFEGDIVKTRASEYGRFIGYVDNAISRFKVRGVKQYKGLSVDLDGTCEIIGNIYENPELLEDN